ncbi:MAG: right-handed parallel beta-helix repeat-containing protein, partial [Thermoplasmata archaeon]
ASDEGAAATHYVPEGYPTIQNAIDSAKAGDEIIIKRGTYWEFIRVNKAITIRGSGSGGTILKVQRPGTIISMQSSSITLEHLELQGVHGVTGIGGDLVMDCYLGFIKVTDCSRGIHISKGDDLVIRGCSVRGSNEVGLYVGGSVTYRFENIIIKDSVFNGNNGKGVELERCRYVEIDGLTASNNGRWGLVAFKVVHAHIRNSTLTSNDIGLKLEDSHAWKVEDNKVSKNRWEGIQLNESGGEVDNVLRRNRIVENSRESGTSYPGISFSGNGASSNLLEYNVIQYNPVGVRFNSSNGGCWNNYFYLNEFRDCSYAIMELKGTGPNTYILNSFRDNFNQASGLNVRSEFDDGTKGNYWSDYKAKYEAAVKDGYVWDKPYQVDPYGSVFDDRPLVYPYEDNPPVVDLVGETTVSIGVP